MPLVPPVSIVPPIPSVPLVPPIPAAVPPLALAAGGGRIQPLPLSLPVPPLPLRRRLSRALADAARVGGRLYALAAVVAMLPGRCAARVGARGGGPAGRGCGLLACRPLVVVAQRQQRPLACQRRGEGGSEEGAAPDRQAQGSAQKAAAPKSSATPAAQEQRARDRCSGRCCSS